MREREGLVTFRYDTNAFWYKGNTHIHSVASDGGKTLDQLADLYGTAGYHFLFRTDHWISSDAANGKQDYPVLWLDGVELDGRDRSGAIYHVVCLGTFQPLNANMGLVWAMEEVRAQGGLLILAHPHWMGNSFDDALRHGFHGVEVYNNVCNWLNGKGYSGPYWSHMLDKNPRVLGIASDDAHITSEHPVWNGGWIMVNAPDLTRESIMQAVHAGNFYSSCGPEIHSIEYDGANVRITCSPVKFARLAGPACDGMRQGASDDDMLTEIEFPVDHSWSYAYVEIEDANGRKAWTNNLFIQDE